LGCIIVWFNRPGTQSTLIPKSGKKNEWIVSAAVNFKVKKKKERKEGKIMKYKEGKKKEESENKGFKEK